MPNDLRQTSQLASALFGVANENWSPTVVKSRIVVEALRTRALGIINVGVPLRAIRMASHFSGFALLLLLSVGAVARAVPLLNEQTTARVARAVAKTRHHHHHSAHRLNRRGRQKTTTRNGSQRKQASPS